MDVIEDKPARALIEASMCQFEFPNNTWISCANFLVNTWMHREMTLSQSISYVRGYDEINCEYFFPCIFKFEMWREYPIPRTTLTGGGLMATRAIPRDDKPCRTVSVCVVQVRGNIMMIL